MHALPLYQKASAFETSARRILPPRCTRPVCQRWHRARALGSCLQGGEHACAPCQGYCVAPLFLLEMSLFAAVDCGTWACRRRRRRTSDHGRTEPTKRKKTKQPRLLLDGCTSTNIMTIGHIFPWAVLLPRLSRKRHVTPDPHRVRFCAVILSPHGLGALGMASCSGPYPMSPGTAGDWMGPGSSAVPASLSCTMLEATVDPFHGPEYSIVRAKGKCDDR